MKNASSVAASLLVACLAGCAAAPARVSVSTAAPVEDCVRLDIEWASAAEARRTALDKQQDAWKAVVPFAVLARHASAVQAAASADKRLALLEDASHRLGCSSHVRS